MRKQRMKTRRPGRKSRKHVDSNRNQESPALIARIPNALASRALTSYSIRGSEHVVTERYLAAE